MVCSFKYKFRVLIISEVKLTCPTTLGERPRFRKDKLLFGEVTVLTLMRSQVL